MQGQEVRFMWLIIFFDLPVKTKLERLQASRFRNFLRRDGYVMLQYSVYARINRGEDAIDKHIRRIQSALPEKGGVRALQVTDKQYGRMKIMLGETQEIEKLGSKQLVLL